MGRLIDADKFKVYLQEYLHYGHAIPWVDAQPTAYDVDAVVAELEEASKTMMPVIPTKDAVAIVRKGGAE